MRRLGAESMLGEEYPDPFEQPWRRAAILYLPRSNELHRHHPSGVRRPRFAGRCVRCSKGWYRQRTKNL